MEIFDEFLVKNVNPFGFDEDRLKLVLYFYLILPFGFIFRKISDPSSRLVFNLLLGLAFTAWLGKGWFLFINAVTIMIYIMMRIKNPFYPVFIMSFIALTYVHIYRLMYDYLSQKFDFNVIQMMITCRYIYYVVDFDKEKRNSFLSYYSYIFMFTNLIIGPVPYKDFMKLINNEVDQTHYRYSFALKTFIQAVLFSAGEVFIRPHIDLDWIHTQTWADMNIIERNLFLLIVAVAIRFRYFCAFKHTQAGMDAIGISYNPETKQCDKFQTADYSYEIEKNALLKTSKWNSLVQQWLKYCFYDRLSKQLGNSAFYAVYVISAIWHGFYLQYYLFFICWAIVNQNMKYFFKAQRKFYFIPQTIRHFLAWLYSSILINQFALAVVLLDWDLGMEYFNKIYWTPHILTGIVFIFFFLTGYGQRESKQKK